MQRVYGPTVTAFLGGRGGERKASASSLSLSLFLRCNLFSFLVTFLIFVCMHVVVYDGRLRIAFCLFVFGFYPCSHPSCQRMSRGAHAFASLQLLDIKRAKDKREREKERRREGEGMVKRTVLKECLLPFVLTCGIPTHVQGPRRTLSDKGYQPSIELWRER